MIHETLNTDLHVEDCLCGTIKILYLILYKTELGKRLDKENWGLKKTKEGF